MPRVRSTSSMSSAGHGAEEEEDLVDTAETSAEILAKMKARFGRRVLQVDGPEAEYKRR